MNEAIITRHVENLRSEIERLRTEQAAVFAALRDALGTSPATFGQAAAQAVKAISGHNTVRTLLAEGLKVLEETPCIFWACDGPDEPFVSMKTCRVCASVQDLRKVLAELGGSVEFGAEATR